jgi:uncharacterized protein
MKQERCLMKIALIGASGTIGQRVEQEALKRGYEVTAIVRHPENIKNPQVKAVVADATDSASVVNAVKGHDVVINAISPGNTPDVLVKAAHALIDGLKQAGVKRLIIVGGAGSLYVAPGLRLMDSPRFNAAWRPVAAAHLDALEVYRTADLDWTFISPADVIQPGERTGKYRVGKDDLLTDDKGESKISTEDYAVALMDEVENAKHLRERITFAYR